MKQFGTGVWIVLTAILVIVVIARIVKWIMYKSNGIKDKISFSWKEKKKAKQIKKELEENKETIINPNSEDTKTDEEFQEVIKTAVAEKNEEDKKEEADNEEKKPTGVKGKLVKKVVLSTTMSPAVVIAY